MAQSCPSCGGDVFLGEARCPSCKATIPGAAESARQAGVEPPTGASGPPPPAGLDLIVQKGVADQDARRAHERRMRDEEERYTGRSFDSTYDDLADAMRPVRDGQGRVVVDWRYALVGGIVVAVVLGVIVFGLINYANNTSKSVSNLRSSTTTTARR
jgi:hypothetical protein